MTDHHTPPPIPPELDRWNWGGFFLTWIWGLGNRVWIALFALIPPVGLVMMIVLGLRGSRMAWAAGGWQDPESFRYAQKIWGWIGAGVWAFFVIMPIALVLTVLGSLKDHPAYNLGMEALNRDARVAEVFGDPLDTGWLVSGSVSSSGASGEADLSIPISGPRASGTAVVKAEKVVGEWGLRSVQARPDGGTVIVVVPR